MNLMSAVTGLFAKVLTIFKRLLCFLHIKRNRKNSGSLLPMHADVKTLAVGEVQTSLPTNDVELESWESWGADDKLERSFRAQHGNAANQFGNRMSGKWSESEPEPEKDYFQEMQLEPEIRRTQKYVIRKKEDLFNSTGSNRLAMMSDIPLSSDLGVLEDSESGWSEEAIEDLAGEAMSAIRNKRRLERERKLMEHQQKKLEKDAQRNNSIKKDRLLTKLS